MTLWKLTLSYDGTTFHGWQIQPGLPTIQGALADAIHSVTGEHILPQGSGRTDAGVHALGQVASFASPTPIPLPNLLRALNHALPPSIRVLHVETAAPHFHARHSAIRKTYEYRIFQRSTEPHAQISQPENVCSPFDAPYTWDCRWRLALEPMQRAAAILCGTHDFTSFAAADPDAAQRESEDSRPNPLKTIYDSLLERTASRITYRVTGSGFLHHMVRNIVGTLVDVGRGSLPPAEMHRILAAKDRSAAGPTAPPQGLFLASVEYPSPAHPHLPSDKSGVTL
ncbi:MAG: tRNA pseudouridine(38-40) synthase TruA [Acidobacteria bacterium]|nr:tRNA pseudouridine(38-40) synthase TruA [Acidobacteriota bacterium]